MAEKNIVQLAITCVVAVIVVAVVMIPIINSIASDNGNGGSGGGSSDPPSEGVLWNLNDPGYAAWEREHTLYAINTYSLPEDLTEEVEINGSTYTGIKLTYEDIQSYGLSFGYVCADGGGNQAMILDADSPEGAYIVIAPDHMAFFDGVTMAEVYFDGATFYTNIPIPERYGWVPVQFGMYEDNYPDGDEYGYTDGYLDMYMSGIGEPYDAEYGYYHKEYSICVLYSAYVDPPSSVSTLRSIDITNPLTEATTPFGQIQNSISVGFLGILPSGVGFTVRTSDNNEYTEEEAIDEGIINEYNNGKFKTVFLMPTTHTANLPGGPEADGYGWGSGVYSAEVSLNEQPPYDAAEYVTENPSEGDNGNGNGSSDLGAAGTILKVIPIFVILGIILYAVQYLRAGKNGL